MPAEGFDHALGASYSLLELIGRGAAGEVWRGVDRRADEPIAAKLLRPEYVDDHELVGRFLRERTILVGLRDPNIVAVGDLVAEGERLAIVMEYVDGGSLRTSLEGGPLPARLAIDVTVAVLDALTLAHRRRVLHRDVKPDNILLASGWRMTAPEGVKLSDFGVSSLIGDRGGGSTTGLIGTPEYMAPELLLTGSADSGVDVYASGVLLYELLAGRTPFAGPGTGYVVAHRHVTMLPPRLPVPDPLWDVLARMLEKDPARRPDAPSAADSLRALAARFGDLPALEMQAAPEGFAAGGASATELRGIELRGIERPAASTPAPSAPAPGAGLEPAEQAGDARAAGGPPATATTARPALPDLGVSANETVLRAMPVVPVTAEPEAPTPARVDRWGLGALRKLRWRSPAGIAAAVALAIAVGVGVYVLVGHTRSPSTGPSPQPSAIPAQQRSPASPAGLTIARIAQWDATAGTAQLRITYSAERAPLRGPFLEVIPGLPGAPCPGVVWEEASARRNVSSVTGIDAACAWAVEPEPILARGSVTVTATVAVGAGPGADLGGDPSAALQEWLETASAATESATSDSETTSTAYPAQRLTNVQVVAPSRTVSGKTLRISLLPVWPNGVDQLNPLFVSPPSGPATGALVSVAGGTSGVRFSDACSGALLVSEDGLVVTAQSVADNCQVAATVGNFTDVKSNTFSISTRGS